MPFSHSPIYKLPAFEPLSLPNSKTVHGAPTSNDLEEPQELRSRVEILAQQYLEGRTLLIQTARLRGPFDKSWVNPWTTHRQNKHAAQLSVDDVHQTQNDTAIAELQFARAASGNQRLEEKRRGKPPSRPKKADMREKSPVKLIDPTNNKACQTRTKHARQEGFVEVTAGFCDRYGLTSKDNGLLRQAVPIPSYPMHTIALPIPPMLNQCSHPPALEEATIAFGRPLRPQSPAQDDNGLSQASQQQAFVALESRLLTPDLLTELGLHAPALAKHPTPLHPKTVLTPQMSRRQNSSLTIVDTNSTPNNPLQTLITPSESGNEGMRRINISQSPSRFLLRTEVVINSAPTAQYIPAPRNGFTAVNRPSTHMLDTSHQHISKSVENQCRESTIPDSKTQQGVGDVIDPAIRNSLGIGSRQCSMCKATITTKWRKGPLGPATLCATCGGRWYRKNKKDLDTIRHQTIGGDMGVSGCSDLGPTVEEQVEETPAKEYSPPEKLSDHSGNITYLGPCDRQDVDVDTVPGLARLVLAVGKLDLQKRSRRRSLPWPTQEDPQSIYYVEHVNGHPCCFQERYLLEPRHQKNMEKVFPGGFRTTRQLLFGHLDLLKNDVAATGKQRGSVRKILASKHPDNFEYRQKYPIDKPGGYQRTRNALEKSAYVPEVRPKRKMTFDTPQVIKRTSKKCHSTVAIGDRSNISVGLPGLPNFEGITGSVGYHLREGRGTIINCFLQEELAGENIVETTKLENVQIPYNPGPEDRQECSAEDCNALNKPIAGQMQNAAVYHVVPTLHARPQDGGLPDLREKSPITEGWKLLERHSNKILSATESNKVRQFARTSAVSWESLSQQPEQTNNDSCESLCPSTQAAMVQAHHDFQVGLESPEICKIEVFSEDTYQLRAPAEDTKRIDITPFRNFSTEAVSTERFGGSFVSTQELFNAGLAISFGSTVKKQKQKKRASFGPSPLAQSVSDERTAQLDTRQKGQESEIWYQRQDGKQRTPSHVASVYRIAAYNLELR